MSKDSVDFVEDKGQPVKYTVIERSLVGQKIYEAGETAEYDGLPAENLAPTCAIGEARYQRYLESNRERQAKQRAEFADANGFDSAAFGKAIAAEISKLKEGEDERVAKIVAAVLSAQKADAEGKTPAKSAKAAPAIA